MIRILCYEIKKIKQFAKFEKYMKKSQFILLILVFGFEVISGQPTGKSSYLKPVSFQKKVAVRISGKTRSYYSLSTEKASVINLQGPGKLHVLTRGQFVSSNVESINYEIACTVDGGEQKLIKIGDAGRSKEAKYVEGSLGVPAISKSFEIDLGRGNHTIEFKLKTNTPSVAARYKFVPAKAKKQEWMAFCPMRPSEPVDLISREETITYYRFSLEKPMKIEIIGPTQLRILTRIENHYQMRGRINYRIQVKENSRVINTYQLNSRRSEVTVYKDDTNLIPGKGCEFVIDVPKGKHIYEIVSLDKDKSSVLGRILIPKKDVKLMN